MTPQKLTRWFFFTVIAALIPVSRGCFTNRRLLRWISAAGASFSGMMFSCL
jgi:hypothetical protein